MRKILFAVALLFPLLGQAQVRLLRTPSYSKGKVAFSYLGDIWIASENGSGADRLTDNSARDIYPRFSPDGNWVAFSSNRDGNYDVFVIPVTGGKPKQLTFHSADDNVLGWTPDGKKILFESSRGEGVFPNVATLWEVPVEGGMEMPIETDWGFSGSFSSDGAKLAFVRHPSVWSRQHYRGSYAADLWVMDVANKKFTKLGDPDYHGNHLWPMYASNGEIYFVADRIPSEKSAKWGGPELMKSVNNIWKVSDRGEMPVQVTHHTSGNLFFPSISADGRTIVYEENFGLWKLDTTTGKSTEIPIEIKSDSKETEVSLVTVQGEAESFHLSPSTKRAAISTHGEIFTVATDRGEIQRVTETPWREDNPRWSPDGKWIAFVSDRTGRQEVWIADELGRNQKQLSDVDCDKAAMDWAPDSKALLWSGSDHKLRSVEIESAKTELIASSDVSQIGTPQFSPDGKWISYSKQDHLLRSHVYVKSASGGTEHQIDSDDFLTASGARWTPDGKKLLILAGVGAPAMSALNRTSLQLYSVALTRIDKDPMANGIDTEAEAEAAAAETPRRGAAGSPKPDVKIEWDGIQRRIRQLTHMAGSVSGVVPAPDSRTYALTAMGGAGGDAGNGGGPGLYTIAEDGTRLTRVPTNTGGNAAGGGRGGRGGGAGGGLEPQWSRDGRTIFYLQGGGLYAAGISAAPAIEGAETGGRGGRGRGAAAANATEATSNAAPRRVNFTVRLEVDQAAERKQVFEEAWRTMKNRFFDPNMNGVNWAAAKDTYEPLLANVVDTEELHDVIMEMIGQLNASHTGISGGGANQGRERILTQYPGFNLEPDSSGYYKVSYIYRKGPADHDYVRVDKGNYILAVNGKLLKTSDNYWKLFNMIPDRSSTSW